ncbi:DMT family transporter [Streptomyces sp. NPDC048560]|uniref:DMT family transporter n=1 Tax=Streptomyces sp. NPDC048560 TaxID=3155488 RepID=UPI0034499048
MNDPGGETVEQQAYITRFLLDYTAVPLAGGTFLRGVLPVRDAVRVVTGAADTVAPHELVAYEVPLSDEDEEPATAPLVLGWTRMLASGPLPHTDATVMGMPLVPVDTTVLEPADSTSTDPALRVLRTLVWLNTVYLAVGAAAIANLLYYRGVGTVGPADASLMMFTVPVVNTLCPTLLLGESFGLLQGTGAVVLLVGAALAATQGKVLTRRTTLAEQPPVEAETPRRRSTT